MGLFNTTDLAVIEEVESATSEKNVEEDWGVIMNICDKAGKSSEDAKNYLKAITKRLYSNDPHIGMKAVTLLDACIKNSGKIFHIEVAAREFENDFNKLMTKAHPTVAKQLRESLKKWSENEFKTDVQLNLIPGLYTKLKSAGYDFSSQETPVQKSPPVSKDPNVVQSQEEEEQILKAIELSLKETSTSKASLSHSSLYPSVNMSGTTPNITPAKEPRKVRALYDFEAAEDNELTFNSGEIIFIIDDTDPNWWKGANQRGEGLFPANFVTADLSVEPEKFLYDKAKKIVHFKESAEVKVVKEHPQEIEINEGKVDRLLHVLHEADPTNPEKDTEEMLSLEGEVNGMGPLIDAELEKLDRKHAQLTQLSADLVEALSLYHTLMREPQFQPMNKMAYGYLPSSTMAFSNTMGPGHPSLAAIHDRTAFIHSGSPPQVLTQQFPMQIENQNCVTLPSGLPTQLPPEASMGQYSGPGLPNYVLPNMPPPAFPHSRPPSQTNLANSNTQQGPHIGNSNTHIAH